MGRFAKNPNQLRLLYGISGSYLVLARQKYVNPEKEKKYKPKLPVNKIYRERLPVT